MQTIIDQEFWLRVFAIEVYLVRQSLQERVRIVLGKNPLHLYAICLTVD